MFKGIILPAQRWWIKGIQLCPLPKKDNEERWKETVQHGIHQD